MEKIERKAKAGPSDRLARVLPFVVASCAPVLAPHVASAQSVQMAETLDIQIRAFDAGSQGSESEEFDTGAPVLVPVPLASPELGIGGGLGAVWRYAPSGEADPAMTSLSLGWTSEGTWGGGISQSLSFDADRFRVTGLAGYGKARFDYYGIGGEAGALGRSIELREKTATAWLDAQARAFDKGLLSHVHAGVRLRYTRMRAREIGDSDPATPRATYLPTALERRSEVAAIGPAFTFDTRNDDFAPRKGVLVTGSWLFGADFLGSDFEHRKLELLSTGYFPVGERTVLAVRKTACAVKGDAPYYDLCMFGRNGDLRGYAVGRYRDGASWALQFEVRHELGVSTMPGWVPPGRLAIVSFVGVGGTARSSGAIWKDSHVLGSGGLGLRYRPERFDRGMLRLDTAWGANGLALTLGLGQAF